MYVLLRYRDIETFRKKLEIERFEHETRFARLHERRMEVIAELYRQLVHAERAFSSWVHPLQMAGEPSKEEKGQAAVEAANRFRSYFLEHRIYLEPGLCDEIAAFDRTLYETYVDLTTYDPDDPRETRDHLDAWRTSWNTVSSRVPELRQSIENRFRELLGILE